MSPRADYLALMRRKLAEATQRLIVVQIVAPEAPMVQDLIEAEAEFASRALALAVSL